MLLGRESFRSHLLARKHRVVLAMTPLVGKCRPGQMHPRKQETEREKPYHRPFLGYFTRDDRQRDETEKESTPVLKGPDWLKK